MKQLDAMAKDAAEANPGPLILPKPKSLKKPAGQKQTSASGKKKKTSAPAQA